MIRRCFTAVGLGFVLMTGSARAQDERAIIPAAPPRTLADAGDPQLLSRFAAPGRTRHYGGGYTGGGRPIVFAQRLDGRDPHTDGTWGWDYVLFGRRPQRVFQGFWHDRPHQPSIGTYKTDGPHVPDVVALKPIQRLRHAAEKNEGHGEGAERKSGGHE